MARRFDTFTHTVMAFRRTRHRRWLAFIALFGLLFQQLAMASYACPLGDDAGMAGVIAAAVDTSADAMPGCDGPVAPDPARCQQHCHPVQASLDHVSALAVPMALLPATTWLREPLLVGTMPTAAQWLQRPPDGASPPLTIQHCTFQI